MKKCYIRAIVLIVLFTGVFLLYPRIIHKNGNIDGVVSILSDTITVNDVVFKINIADTKLERTRGLSGMKMLPKNEGLLFIFDTTGVYPFWMKDMNFPIDIIWVDENLEIVYIKENATPESFPELFNSKIKALYVLEVNAGEIKKNKIKIGDNLILGLIEIKQ